MQLAAACVEGELGNHHDNKWSDCHGFDHSFEEECNIYPDNFETQNTIQRVVSSGAVTIPSVTIETVCNCTRASSES